ncbi:MAG: cupin domain-containing protein [Desulfovibrionales bacterium]
MKKLFLGFCFLCLLSSPAIADEVQGLKTEVLVKTDSSWDGTLLPRYPKGQPEITMLKITIPAGFDLPLHEHPVINAGILLRGELTVTTEEGEVLKLRAGDPIVEVVNKWHSGKNKGNTSAEILVFYAGQAGMPITVKQ